MRRPLNQRPVGPRRPRPLYAVRHQPQPAAPHVDPKAACPGCCAAKTADPIGRWPVGDCGQTCVRRQQRLSAANPQPVETYDPQADPLTIENMSTHTNEGGA